MLSLQQFDILNEIYKSNKEKYSEIEISNLTKLSFEEIDSTIKELKENNFIDENFKITAVGFSAMEPYKVDNAIIMAAGMSSRFAPLSYETPKGLLNVKGEKLIEREILQLKEKGINDITLVVGYMKEKMSYLAEKFKIEIVENNDYFRFNNTSSLILVTEKLKNTYICSSDNYFTVNPFEKYVYRAYYSAIYGEGETNEYCINVDEDDRIKDVKIGGIDSWYMLGHVYFDKNFSEKFAEILKREYEKPKVKEILWEDLYIRHIKELDMYMRKYSTDEIKEFDSLDELRVFDEKYIKDTGSNIFKNICEFLNCREEDIADIKPLKNIIPKTSFKFNFNEVGYIYRHNIDDNGKWDISKFED